MKTCRKKTDPSIEEFNLPLRQAQGSGISGTERVEVPRVPILPE